jgi:hypothetical protein
MAEIVPNENKPLIMLHTGHFRSKYTSTVSFAIGTLLFLLPFLNIKCNDTKLMSATGVQMAVGFKVEPSGELNSLTNGILGNENRRDIFEDRSTSGNDTSKTDKAQVKNTLPPNYFLLTAMIMALAATVISFIPFKNRWMFCYIAGWVSVLGFLITIIWVLVELKQYSVNLGGFINLSVNFTAWFFLSLLAVVAGSLFSHNLSNREWQVRRQQEIDAYMRECGYNEQNVSVEPLIQQEA